MIINTNTAAMNTHRQMGINQDQQQSAMEKLSSGLRINKAGDDAAGLAISEKMRGQINGLDQASRNAQDGISMIQTAEGALDESHSILQRMRELSVQSANDTNVDADREELQNEVDQLTKELDRIAENTEFNTQNLLDGSFEDKTLQIGANEGQNLDVSIDDMGSKSLGVAELTSDPTQVGDNDEFNVTNFSGENVSIEIADGGKDQDFSADFSDGDLTINLATDSGGSVASTNQEVLDEINKIDGLSAELADGNDGTTTASATKSTTVAQATDSGVDISTQENADSAISRIDSAIENVSSQRSELGAVQNRLEHTISNLDNSSENLSAAESRIRDADMAAQMMEQTQASVKSQAAQSMLAQANQQPQSVLQLLG